MIQQPKPLPTPVPLAELREAWPQFNPPQGFLYLSANQVRFVLDRIETVKGWKAAA
jgi:hypothetical protein